MDVVVEYCGDSTVHKYAMQHLRDEVEVVDRLDGMLLSLCVFAFCQRIFQQILFSVEVCYDVLSAAPLSRRVFF